MRTICFIAVFSFMFGSVHGATSPNSLAKKVNQTSIAQANAAPNQPGTEALPVFVKIVHARDVEAEVAREKKEEDRDGWDRAMAMATIALAGITLALAFFTGLLWWQTLCLAKDARSASERQSADTKESLRIADNSAQTAEKHADATKAMVETMKDNAIRDLRAYLSIEKEEGKLPKFQNEIEELPECYHVVTKNSGQTPATNVIVSCGWEEIMGQSPIWPADKPFQIIEHSPNEGIGQSIVGRDQCITTKFYMRRDIRTRDYDAAFQRMRAGKSVVFFFGRISYDDVFKVKRRTTTFCHVVMFANGRYDHSICPRFNDLE